jgi:hypothetical protein
VADRNSPQEHVWRARTVPATADGHGTAGVVRRAGRSEPCVRRRQERFVGGGAPGPPRDETRPPRVLPLARATTGRAVEPAATEPPRGAAHRAAAATAAAVGISPGSAPRVRRARKPRPHRARTLKPSEGPAFVAGPRGIVGLYPDPPAHTVVPPVDGGAGYRRSTAPSRDRR